MGRPSRQRCATFHVCFHFLHSLLCHENSRIIRSLKAIKLKNKHARKGEHKAVALQQGEAFSESELSVMDKDASTSVLPIS